MGLLMFGGLALFSLGTFAFGRGLPGWVFAEKTGENYMIMGAYLFELCEHSQ